MPEDTVFDSTDKGTLRPDAKPLRTKGDAFYPMKLPDFGWEITLPENASPDDPITLFTMYYTPEIMDMIVERTNEYAREPEDDSLPYARANQWYPTCRGELYIYFAIRIYMTLYVMNEISDYWDTSKFTPDHSITSYMSRNRFQELHMRVRLAGREAEGPYAKVSFILLFLLTHLLILASFRLTHLALIYKTSIYESGSLEETLR
jgi:Transposase IS4